MENLLPFFYCTGWNGRGSPAFGYTLTHPEEFEAKDFLPHNTMTKEEFINHITSLPDKCLFHFSDFENSVHKDGEIGKRILKRKANIKYSYTIPEMEG
jgi:hypothetical protein